MKVIESDKVVPLCRLLMMNIPSAITDLICKDIQDVVDMHSFDAAPTVAVKGAEKLIATMRNNKKAALWLKKYAGD